MTAARTPLPRKAIDPSAPGSTWRDRVSAVATCAALGPVCIAGLATGSAYAVANESVEAAEGVRDGVVSEGRGLISELGDAAAEVAGAATDPLAEVSSAVRWATVAIVSVAFLILCFLIAWALTRVGVL